MKENNRQICEDQIVTFKQSHILLYQGLLFLTRSTCVIADARSHTCKSHDFIPRYDIIQVESSSLSTSSNNSPTLFNLFSSLVKGSFLVAGVGVPTPFTQFYQTQWPCFPSINNLMSPPCFALWLLWSKHFLKGQRNSFCNSLAYIHFDRHCHRVYILGRNQLLVLWTFFKVSQKLIEALLYFICLISAKL